MFQTLKHDGVDLNRLAGRLRRAKREPKATSLEELLNPHQVNGRTARKYRVRIANTWSPGRLLLSKNTKEAKYVFWLCVSRSFVIDLRVEFSCEAFSRKTYLLSISVYHTIPRRSKMFIFPFSWDLLLLFFCVVESKTITSTITLSVPLPSSTQISSTYSADADIQSSVLNSTNFYRKQHNASELTWNSSLATYAASYAEKCLWAHSVRFRQHTLCVHLLFVGVLTPLSMDLMEKTWPKAFSTPLPLSKPGATSAASTISIALPGSATPPVTSRSWYGRTQRAWGAGEKSVITQTMPAHTAGSSCASIGHPGT